MPRAKMRRMFTAAIRAPALRTVPIYALIALMLVVSGRAAAASSAELRLRGQVPAVCTVSISNSSADLNITQGGTGVQVATVTEQCNSASGYTVRLTSANGGRMVQESGGAGVPYALSYDDAETGTGGGLTAARPATGAPRQRTLLVTVPPNPQAQAGSYADTVTVSIQAK